MITCEGCPASDARRYIATPINGAPTFTVHYCADCAAAYQGADMGAGGRERQGALIPITADRITALARAAGLTGETWARFTLNDEAQAFVCYADTQASDAAIKAWEAAHRAGTIERMTTAGWVRRWTTAPADYDGFDTITVETCAAFKGRPLRCVLIDPAYQIWQADRYASGLHGVWDEDPHAEEARRAEQRARWAREDEERAAKREAGLAWLRAAELVDIDDVIEADGLEARGLTYGDARDERARRLAEQAERERVEEIAEARALVRPGVDLIDGGKPGEQGRWGHIPGRAPTVHYAITERGHDRQTADEIMIHDAAGAEVGSLAMIADRIRRGDLRIATEADQLPPAPVLRRVGLDRRADVMRIEVRGRVVWVARERFGAAPRVLDERGHIVRSRLVRADALSAHHLRTTATYERTEILRPATTLRVRPHINDREYTLTIGQRVGVTFYQDTENGARIRDYAYTAVRALGYGTEAGACGTDRPLVAVEIDGQEHVIAARLVDVYNVIHATGGEIAASHK